MKTVKKLLIGVAVSAAIYFIVFHTPFVVNRMDSYDKWVARFHRIQAGDYDSSGFISIEEKDKLRDDFVDILRSHQRDLIFGVGGDSFARIRPNDLAWREDKSLYILNLAPLLGISPNFEY